MNSEPLWKCNTSHYYTDEVRFHAKFHKFKF